MFATWYLVMFLVFLAILGLVAGAVLLAMGLRGRPQIAAMPCSSGPRAP